MGPVAVSNGRMQDAGDACSEQHLIITNEPASLNVRGFQNLIPANYAARSSGNPTQRRDERVFVVLPKVVFLKDAPRNRDWADQGKKAATTFVATSRIERYRDIY